MHPAIVICCIYVFASLTPASTNLDSNYNYSQCDSAISLMVRQKYLEAKVLINEYLRKCPLDNNALYISFAIEQTRILDYESYVIEQKEFQKFADSLRTIFEHRLPALRERDSIKCLFYIANVYGGMSIMLGKTGKWFDAAKNAMTSVSILKQVRDIEPEFYAAYLGIGVFQYYLKSSFKWFPFISDKDDNGITTVETALKSEFPYDYAAKNSFCWILIEQDQYKRADSLAQTVLIDIPDNTIFLRIRMMIALWTQQYDCALKISESFIKLTQLRQPRNWADLITGYAVLVNSYKETGNITKMRKTVDYVLSQPIPAAYTAIPHVKKYLKQMNEINQKYKNVTESK